MLQDPFLKGQPQIVTDHPNIDTQLNPLLFLTNISHTVLLLLSSFLLNSNISMFPKPVDCTFEGFFQRRHG